ncbi:MAG TPA: response regulator [Candidatus Poseidoniales archaeon]|nr:response regulator [Candidatus Poseidoniales archaeon]HIB41708.1 response regulator [Candidatus Poseidoniales archaeon]HIO25145.1 response regulator [Candidatus Poseidoniales archaeon]
MMCTTIVACKGGEPMVRVTEVTDEEAPLALLVDNNEMALYRMNEIFRQRNYRIIECKNGDKAVDLFITEQPDLVIISLDIPGLDGHVAALEMRESRQDTRVIFTTPRNKLELAEDAAFSAGAVALLQKPVTQSSIDEVWDLVMGDIPDAPGIEDLDQLYPDVDADVEVTIELDGLPEPPPPSALPALGPPPKRRKKGKRLLMLAILLFFGSAGAISYGLYTMGYIPL